MKLWPSKFGAQIGKIASSFSLMLVVSLAFSQADYYHRLDDSLHAAKDKASMSKFIKSLDQQFFGNIAMGEALKRLQSTPLATWTDEDIDTIREGLHSLAVAEGAPTTHSKLPDPKLSAIEITSTTSYKDLGEKQTSNWMGAAFERLGRWLASLFDRDEQAKSGEQGGGLNIGWLKPTIWTILGIAVLLLLTLAIKHFSWNATLRRKAKLMLTEDEPERTLDEWLERANQLENEGHFREAVRCLYLACLLKFDEARIARFIRAETNWEHLQRINMSSTKPESLQFLSATKLFDKVWYGQVVRGSTDASEMRGYYLQVSEAVSAGANLK